MASCGALPLATEPSFPGATTIYIGGQNGVDETGKAIASHDAAAQAVRAIDNAETVLRAAGATLADVVAWTVLIAAGADVAAACSAIAPRLARAGAAVQTGYRQEPLVPVEDDLHPWPPAGSEASVGLLGRQAGGDSHDRGH